MLQPRTVELKRAKQGANERRERASGAEASRSLGNPSTVEKGGDLLLEECGPLAEC